MRFQSFSVLVVVACGLAGSSLAVSQRDLMLEARAAAESKGSSPKSISPSKVSSAKAGPTKEPPPARGAAGTPGSQKIIAITVGAPDVNKSLVFVPNEVQANPGDVLQFQFYQKNHTVTQSTFTEVCQPTQGKNITGNLGIHSGFIPGPTAMNATIISTFDVAVYDTQPMWLYCAQGPHCRLGMVMVVNPPTSGTETFAAYKAASAKATSNVPANNVAGGMVGSIPMKLANSPPA